MHARRFLLLGSALLSLALVAGCASETAAPPAAAEEGDTEVFSEEVRSKTDAEVKAAIEAAAAGAIYVSESDYPFTYVTAKLEGQKTITQALVREKLASYVDGDPAADKPLATLVAMNASWPEWKKRFDSCSPDEYPGPTECAAIKKMNDALEKNLRGIKLMYFGRDGSPGHVDGVGVSVIIVGRTPAGNLAGVRTIAIWT